jgi:hypothetical protein
MVVSLTSLRMFLLVRSLLSLIFGKDIL